MSERTVELVHSVYDRGTWATVVSRDLQGLFDVEDARRCDIGRTLGELVKPSARRRGDGFVFCLMHESSHHAMPLYACIADHSRFIHYRKLVA